MFFNNNRIFMGKDLASKIKVAKATQSAIRFHCFISCLVLDCDPVWYYHLVEDGKSGGFADRILGFICVSLFLFW